jgi:hypothetical protein
MYNLFDPHSFRSVLKVVTIVILLFVLVNVF